MPPRDRGFFTAVADQLERRGYCRFDPLHGTPKTLLRHLALAQVRMHYYMTCSTMSCPSLPKAARRYHQTTALSYP